MKTQHYGNHHQHDKIFYAMVIFVPFLGLGMGYVVRRINTLITLDGLQYIMPFALVIFMILFLVKMRLYGTRLQDRIIRQEVSLRYYIATQKKLPDLKMSQIVAARFAGDDEFVSVIDYIVKNPHLTNNDIKLHIKHWKGDYDRI